jgi:acyl-CoA synthetase (AMP-forming)/AMP-acid ligase II
MRDGTLAQLVHERAVKFTGEPALRFKEGDGYATWTWDGFAAAQGRFAAALKEHGVRAGDHVMLVVPEPASAVTAHFGVWTLGATPTHVGLPYRLTNVNDFLDELRRIAAAFGTRAVIVSRAVAAFAQPEAGDVRVLVLEDLVEQGASLPVRSPSDPVAPALLQLTSGSTGRPRGVLIPHDRLNDHLDAISTALPGHPDWAAGVIWLPLYHDMGMIGGLLYPLWNRFVMHVLSPLEFQSRPLSWLAAMSEVRATHTAAPPSAYAICLGLARRAAEMGLDLSSLSCAMIGAEPISAKLLRRFGEAFAPCKFRPEGFFPVYGLAEATVAVTFPPVLRATRVDRVDRHALEGQGRAEPAGDAADALELVSVGKPLPRSEVRVVGDDGLDLPERRTGEILVRAPSLMTGYHRDPDATEAALKDGWLVTGDLGYLADGELFITGRRKEIIIKGGRNYAPAAIEEIASHVPGVRAGCVAAVGVRSEERQTEMLCVLAETKLEPSEHPALAERLREALKAHGIAVDHVRLAAPGSLPKTTSGKIRRGAVAEAWKKESG